jgi:hypothetical protein
MEILAPYQKPKQRSMNQREYRAALRGDSWKMKLITAIDNAVSHSSSRQQFIANMESMGYGVKWIDHYKYITYTAPNGQKCRDNRLFDDKYLKSNMEGMFNELERAQGTQQGNERYSDRTVSATVDWSKVGTVERSGEAHNNGRNGDSQEHGFDLQAADTAGGGRSDGGYRDASSVCNEGNHAGRGSEIESYHRISNPDSQQFTDQYDDEAEFRYDEADENAGLDAAETQSKVGVGWGDVALGAIALGAAIETMVNSNDNGRKKKNYTPKTESRDKKKRPTRDHGYDLSL